MTEITKAELHHLDLIEVVGKDALTFLQGQCTQDVNSLEANTPTLGAFCNAKGRMISNVWMLSIEAEIPTILLLSEKSAAPVLMKHLSKYAAFFRGTSLKHLENDVQFFGVFTGGSASSLQTLTVDSDTGFMAPWGISRTLIGLKRNSSDYDEIINKLSEFNEQPEKRWLSADILEKRLWLSAHQSEAWIPQNLSLDELDGISFTKGCYTGQEVIARLHYKGQSKKRLYGMKWPTQSNDSSAHIYQNEKSVGDVVQTATDGTVTYALVVAKTEAVQQTCFVDENQQVAIELLH